MEYRPCVAVMRPFVKLLEPLVLVLITTNFDDDCDNCDKFCLINHFSSNDGVDPAADGSHSYPRRKFKGQDSHKRKL